MRHSRTNNEIDSKRRSIQSYIGINFFSSKNLVFTMPQIALFSAALSVLNNALTNEVRIEERWLVLNLGCSGTAYFCSDNRGAAADESSPDRLSKCYLPFREPDPRRGLPAGAARAWLRG